MKKILSLSAIAALSSSLLLIACAEETVDTSGSSGSGNKAGSAGASAGSGGASAGSGGAAAGSGGAAAGSGGAAAGSGGAAAGAGGAAAGAGGAAAGAGGDAAGAGGAAAGAGGDAAGSGGAAAGAGGDAAGAGGAAAGAAGAAAGTGGAAGAPSGSAAALADAYGTGDACAVCVGKMTGKSTQEDKIDCGTVVAACDADTSSPSCADFIATLKDARAKDASDTPDCWTFTALVSTNSSAGNDLAICTVEQCAKECGGGDGSTFTKGFLTECKP